MTAEDFLNAGKEEYVIEPIGDENMNSSLIEGDMVFDEDNTSEYEGYEMDIVADKNRKWSKDGDYVIVPFEFKPDLAEGIKARIAKAVMEFQNNTCIRHEIIDLVEI